MAGPRRAAGAAEEVSASAAPRMQARLAMRGQLLAAEPPSEPAWTAPGAGSAAAKVKQFSYRNPECGLRKNMLMKKISPGLLFYYRQSHRVSV